MTEMIIPNWEMDFESSMPLEYESELLAAFQGELSQTRAEQEIQERYINLQQQRLQQLADINGWDLQPLQEYSGQLSELIDEANQIIDQQNSETMSDLENRFQTLTAKKQKLLELEAELATAQADNREGIIINSSGYTLARTGKTVFMHDLSWNTLYLMCDAYIDPQDGLSIPYSALDTSVIFEFIPPITGYYRFESEFALEALYFLIADSWDLSPAFAAAIFSTWFQVEQNGLLPRQEQHRMKIYGSEFDPWLSKKFCNVYDIIYAAVLQKGELTRIHVGVKLETLARGFSNSAKGSFAKWSCLPATGYFTVPCVQYRV